MVLKEDIPKYKFHPVVLEKLIDADLIDTYLPKSNEENEMKFWEQVNDAKQPVKKQINKIVRIRNEGKEHFYCHQRLSSSNVVGNPIHCNVILGKYDDPIILKRYDPKTRRPQTAEIDGFETKYEYEWPKDFTSEMEEQLIENIDLVIVTAGRKYGGFNFADFQDKSFDELVTIGKYGTSNPIIINEIKKKIEKSK